MILRALLWLIRKHPAVAHVDVTLWQDVAGMHVEAHEVPYKTVWQ